MKPLYAFVLSAFAATAALAGDAFVPVPAAQVVISELMFVKRPVVIFADTPNDPNFTRQMELIARDPKSLADRGVVVITDTDPAAKTELRQKLRPRGFSLVLMDKDWQPEIRKPLPWDVREISHAIDKFPLRRQEVNERPAAGG
ncbi:methylmalonyl-CoA epimerase [Gemmobacter aquarius]|uniref:Methylmalonyl-CoA epimerase n=2 Tax=Paragemmobacter aquarius TaxID=2169400 RepID=A0A2S0UR35_9RHOB|nr:methylmalonyl-CoA epimerase [Gemmobacter aquarius]